MWVALGDRFWLFIQTLNKDKKSFNSIFDSKIQIIHSKNSFIPKKSKIIHSKNLFIQKNPELFIQRKYSFKWKMDYPPGLIVKYRWLEV